MAQPARYYYSPEEYLRMEEQAVEKHEYIDGGIYLMAGGTPKHNSLTSNINAELNIGLRHKNCTVFSGDMRIATGNKDFFSYADTSVVCGELELLPGRTDTITNPVVIVEVLSPSTQSYDRGEKFEHYRAIASLQSYILIDQRRVYVEHHRRVESNKWLMEMLTELEQTLVIPTLELNIPLANIYSKVDFEN